MSTDKIQTNEDIDPEMAEVMKYLGNIIGKDMPEGFGFALMLFHIESLSIFYVSSAQRDAIIKVMREFIKRYETQ